MDSLSHRFRIPTVRTFDSFDPTRGLTPWNQAQLEAARNAAQAFADDPTGCFVLVGPSGTGKSHLAMALAHTIQARENDVSWIFVPTFLNELRASMHGETEMMIESGDVLQRVAAAPCIVLDGFGTGNETPWSEAQLYQIVAQRADHHLPTVITTNRVLETFHPLVRTRLAEWSWSVVCPVVGYESECIHTLVRSITPAQREMTFESFNRQPFSPEEAQRSRYNLAQITSVIEAFSEHPRGKTVVLMGQHGSGKTHLALAVANRQWELGRPCVYVNFPQVLDRLRSGSRGEAVESLETMLHVLRMVPFLIIDNFSTDQATAWVRQICFQLIDDRLSAEQATLLCTPQTLQEIDAPLRSRFTDHHRVAIMALVAPDYRPRRRR